MTNKIANSKGIEPEDCPVCDGPTRAVNKAMTVSYREHERKIKVPVRVCRSCKEILIHATECKVLDLASQRLRADIEGIVTPQQVLAIRKSLKLSQKRAGLLIGGGPSAFQKYEAGTAIPAVSMSHLLRMLQAHPELVAELPGNTQSAGTRAPATPGITRLRNKPVSVATKRTAKAS